MAEIVLLGGGGHARVVLAALVRLGHRVVGYAAPSPEGACVEVPYLGRDDDVLGLLEACELSAVLGVGKTSVDDGRMRLMATYETAGFTFPALVAPNATVHAATELGSGTIVLDGAVVVTGSKLGRGCIVNTNASVDHDCRLGHNVHVAPGATVCGDVAIGANCVIGAGATIIPGIRLCAGVLIGAGATVVDDITEAGTYRGTPAGRV